MTKYEVGYGKPPKHSQFRTGVSGNPRGRPKRKVSSISEIIDRVLGASAEYLEGGRPKKTTRQELVIRALAKDALKGDVGAAEMLLKIRNHAQRSGDIGDEIIHLHNWLPDYPGQTADQKTGEQEKQTDADSPKWWAPPANRPERDTQ
jgi:Family of unknown function (DUF5681)